MTLAVLRSRALDGLGAPEVTVEVHLANGLPAFNLVGLPDVEVKEARDRVRSAIVNSGFEFPARRITVNLAPADLPKESGRFDLPIALGILAAGGQIPAERLDAHEFAGELSLSGELRAIRGTLPMCLGARGGARSFILPAASAAEAALAATPPVLPARTLLEVAAHLSGSASLAAYAGAPLAGEPAYPDLADVRGQALARRALEISAAAGHSLLMSGPPGTGKSMLAARLPGLLPPMGEDEALEAAAMQSLGHGSFDLSQWRQRPCRAPHHTSSAPALVGGGALARPGEISLADHGILFLDELPEFDRRVLEVLREPLETGRINVSRAARRASYPARFVFVAAMNPCPCGYRGHASDKCRCTPDQVARYRGRISGPLLDRIDLHVDVGSLDADELQAAPTGEASATVRARVIAAREVQAQRQDCVNSRLDAAGVDRHCRADDAGLALLRQAVDRLHLSARAYHRILKVARTIADLAASEAIRRDHLAEAIQFRRQLEAPA